MTPDQAQAEFKQAWDDDELVGQLKDKIETLEGSLKAKTKEDFTAVLPTADIETGGTTLKSATPGIGTLKKADTEQKIRQLKAKMGAIKSRSFNPNAALNIMRANTAPKPAA
jgi:hypothetical protein